MKLRLSFFLGLCATVATALVAQEPGPAAAPTRSPEQLDELLGPIALYPDALVALILPAATASSDVVLAQRYLSGGGDTALIDDQGWDDSVKSLARYPEVMSWMDENLAWTKQVGEAFVVQPADVMQSIQRLRAKARAVGSLTDTPQQVVVVDDSNIRIVPADPEVIYVPYYDPEVVYVERRTYYPDPFITFGLGFHVGWWLSYDCDWYHRSIWVSDRRRDWVGYREWRHPVFPGNPGYVSRPDRHPWTPPPNSHRFEHDGNYRPRVDVVARPTPNRDPRSHGSDSRSVDVQRQTAQQRYNDRPQQTSGSNSNRTSAPTTPRENWRTTNARTRPDNPTSASTATQPASSAPTPAAAATPTTPPSSNRITAGQRDRQYRGDRGNNSSNAGGTASNSSAPAMTTPAAASTPQPRFTAPATPPPAPAAIVRGNPSSSRENTGYGNTTNRGRESRTTSAPVSQPAPAVTAPRERPTYSPRVNNSQPQSQPQYRSSAPAPQPAYVPPQPAAAPASAPTYVAPAQSAPAPQQQPAPPPQQQREQRHDGHRQRGDN